MVQAVVHRAVPELFSGGLFSEMTHTRQVQEVPWHRHFVFCRNSCPL